jgi:ribosomal protein L11 methyltransferase
MRRWPALDLSVAVEPAPAGWEDALAAALDDLGPTAIQEGSGSWRAFFGSAGDRDRALAALREAGPPWLAVSALDVDDEDWARRSQDSLGPVRVGRVVISPPWAAARPPAEDLVEILILPSMGFGTGHHASTRLCTALLQEVDLRGRSVLDVGTGSGVLALVALRLGAAAVHAVDEDPDALAAAADNLELNGATAGITLRHADFRQLAGLSADVVSANLTGALLARSADLLAAAVLPGGSLIVSGVTAEEETEVTAALAPPPVVRARRPAPCLSLVSRLAEDGWVGLRFEKGSRSVSE